MAYKGTSQHLKDISPLVRTQWVEYNRLFYNKLALFTAVLSNQLWFS